MNASDVTAYVLKYKFMLQLKLKSSQTCRGYCFKNSVPVPASHHLSSIGCTGKSLLLSWNLTIVGKNKLVSLKQNQAKAG